MAVKNDCGMAGKSWREHMMGNGWRENIFFQCLRRARVAQYSSAKILKKMHFGLT